MISDEIKNQLVAQERTLSLLDLVGSCEPISEVCSWSAKANDASNYGTSTVIGCKYISSDVYDPSIVTNASTTDLYITGEYGLATFDQISYKFKDIETNEKLSGSGWPPTDPRVKYMYELIEDPRLNRDVTHTVEFIIEFDFSSLGTPPTSDIATSDPITYNVYVDSANQKAYRKDHVPFAHTVRNYSYRKFADELPAILSGTISQSSSTKTLRILYGINSNLALSRSDIPQAKVFDVTIKNGEFINALQVGSTIEGLNTIDENDFGMGFSVSLSKDGTIAAISSPLASNYPLGIEECGRVKVYEYNGINWTQKGSTLYADETGQPPQLFPLVGWSVDLSDDGLKLLIQSSGGETDEGYSTSTSTYYVYENGDWVRKTRDGLLHRQGVRGQMSGNGKVIAVTNPNGVQPRLVISEYNSSSDSWSRRQSFDYPTGIVGAGVGLDVNSDGSRICTSTNNNSVAVYDWDGSLYRQIGSTIVGAVNDKAVFCRMNDAGDVVAIAAPGSGIIRVYRWYNTRWIKDDTDLNMSGTGLEINPTGDIIVGSSGTETSIFQYYNGDCNNIGSLNADSGPFTNSNIPGSMGPGGFVYGQFTIGLSELV